MTKAKLSPYLAVLAGLALAACSGGAPSNNLVLETLNAGDELARAGCIKYFNLIRENGFPREESYRVEFRVDKVLLMKTGDCAQAMASNDPFKLLGEAMSVLSGGKSTLWDLAMLEADGGQKTVWGQVTLVKSEKGWVATDVSWKN